MTRTENRKMRKMWMNRRRRSSRPSLSLYGRLLSYGVHKAIAYADVYCRSVIVCKANNDLSPLMTITTALASPHGLEDLLRKEIRKKEIRREELRACGWKKKRRETTQMEGGLGRTPPPPLQPPPAVVIVARDGGCERARPAAAVARYSVRGSEIDTAANGGARKRRRRTEGKKSNSGRRRRRPHKTSHLLRQMQCQNSAI